MTMAERGVCAGAGDVTWGVRGAGAEARGVSGGPGASGGRGGRAEYTTAPRTLRPADDHAVPVCIAKLRGRLF